MGSPTFGLPGTSNNAPLPVPGNTNPTGTNSGVGFGGSSFPNYPMFGSPSGVQAPFTSPSSLYSTPWSGTTGGLASLGSGFDLGNNWQAFANELGGTYGKGPGQAIYNILSEGLFNPQDAAAILNAMQPGNMQGLASVQNSFGGEGARFGSEADLGISNYESQVNLNEQSTLAQMYMQAQAEQLGLLQSVLPAMQQHKSDSGVMGTISDVLGITGALGITMPNSYAALQSLPYNQQSSAPSTSYSTPSFGNTAPSSTMGNLTDSGATLEDYIGSSTAGADLGGASSSGAGSFPLGALGAFF